MYIEKFYSKRHQKAYVVLGFCKRADDVIFELQLFENGTGITIPAEITVVEIAEYKYAGMVVVKFYLHPVEVFDKKGGEWRILDDEPDAVKLLKPKQ